MLRFVVRAAAAASPPPPAVTSPASAAWSSMMTRRGIVSAATAAAINNCKNTPSQQRRRRQQHQQRFSPSFSNGVNESNKYCCFSTSTAKSKAKGVGMGNKDSWKRKGKGAAASSKDSSTPSSNPRSVSMEEIEALCKAEEEDRDRLLAEDEKDESLDVGPTGRPIFTSAASLSHLTKEDACTYLKFDQEQLQAVLPEGLPVGMSKEFKDSRRSALLIRQSFLDLRDNFKRIVDPPLHSSRGKGSTVRRQIVLDGPVSCGKSIALAMLVHWARDEGWLVFYAPRGREWTHGGFCYKNPLTDLWDTPSQAANVLQDFLSWNGPRIQNLLCQILEPIPLGEGAGIGWLKGVDSMEMPDGSTLYDLVQMGLTSTHAAVGVVVRLRKELSLVKDIPVLIAIDQYNSWFTFSEYEEPYTGHDNPEYIRSCRPVHAKNVAMVNAFRPMMHNDLMVGAFSHSTAVGKLRLELPDVPVGARIYFPRYNIDEAAAVSHYYVRQRLVRRELFSEEKWKKAYYLSNGNGAEMRWLISQMH